SNAAADRRGQRTLDANEIVPKGFDGVVGKPVIELLVTFFAGIDFHPCDLAFPAIGFLDRGVEHAHAGAPDVRTGAVALDERNDRMIGNDQATVLSRNRGTSCWRRWRTRVCHRL